MTTEHTGLLDPLGSVIIVVSSLSESISNKLLKTRFFNQTSLLFKKSKPQSNKQLRSKHSLLFKSLVMTMFYGRSEITLLNVKKINFLTAIWSTQTPNFIKDSFHVLPNLFEQPVGHMPQIFFCRWWERWRVWKLPGSIEVTVLVGSSSFLATDRWTRPLELA